VRELKKKIAFTTEVDMRRVHIAVWISFAALFAGAPLSASVLFVTATPSLTSVEGNAFSGTLGTFTDSDGADPSTNYTATVNWGDGSPIYTGATVTGSTGSYTVTGGHTYAEEGTFTFSLGIIDADGSTASGIGTVTVSDAPLSQISAPSLGFTPGVPFNATVGNFRDGNPLAPTTDFIATINWGDSTTSAGTIGGNPGDFTVSGSHTYAVGGTFTVSDQIDDAGGAELDMFSTANTAPEPGSLGMILAGLGSLSLLAWRRRYTA
jgi:hypothetical protein